MRGNSGRIALLVWAAFAFVTWNVVFDRDVYVAAVQFTQQQIEQHERGQPVASIEQAYRPQVREAAVRAAVWGGAVLAAGILLVTIASRQGRRA